MYFRERDGAVIHGVQFLELDADKHRALGAFIEAVLRGGGGGDREHPRVQRRVEVVCKTKTRARAVLQDISKGGLRVAIDDLEVSQGDEIEIAVSIGKLPKPLALHGRVVRTSDVDGLRFAGVRLDALDAADAALLDQLLTALVSK